MRPSILYSVALGGANVDARHHTAERQEKEKIEKVPPCATATAQSAAANSISSVMDVDVSPQTAVD